MRIIVRKITQIKTIGVTKVQGNFVEISLQAKFLRKATKSQEFRRNLFALLLHNTVHLSEERHFESTVSWPRAQHNVPGQGWNPDRVRVRVNSREFELPKFKLTELK